MPRTTVNIDSLYAALDQKRIAEKVSWREVAQQLKIPSSTFTRMAQGHRPDVDAFTTLLGWLGMTAENFVTSSSEQQQEEPLAMISTYLRSAQNIRPEDAEALEDIIQVAYRRLVRERDKRDE